MIVVRLKLIVILGLIKFCRAYTAPANPPMLTHASMDVGNIISIVIPESPDENINIDQLTGEFRQQLERIKKQSRASKVEHGLVTLKRVLPEMSREEKRKTLPLIRRVLHGRRVPNVGGKNWTRDASQVRESGQFVRGRSAGNMEERRNYRDYEESVNRESATTRMEQSIVDDYRRMSDRNYGNRRDEDSVRRGEQIRQDDLIRHEESGRREERIIFTDEDPSKITRAGQDWTNWDDQSRGDTRIYPETSTIDRNHKSVNRQKEPTNEILQFDRLEKLGKFEPRGPDEPNVDCTKIDQQLTSRYPIFRQDPVENGKRSFKDSRGYEVIDVPTFVNYPREYDVSSNSNPDCEVNKTRTIQPSKDREISRETFDKQRQENINYERDAQKITQTILIQEPREQFDRSNLSGIENIVPESIDDFGSKKKLVQTEDFRGSMKSNPVIRSESWNVPSIFDDRRSNSSDDVKNSPNVYEMFGEKDLINAPGLSYIQTDQGIIKENLDNEPKIAASQQSANYGSRILRIQRAVSENDTLKISRNSSEATDDNERRVDNSIFGKLKRLFKSPNSPKIHNRIILVYANESTDYIDHTRETKNQTGESSSAVLSTILEPTSATRRKIETIGSTTNSNQIKANENHVVKPHVKFST